MKGKTMSTRRESQGPRGCIKGQAWYGMIHWLIALAMLSMGCPAFAQDADEKPVPIDPATAAAQNRILGIILLIVLVGVGFYLFRRWQASHSGSKDQDWRE